MTTEFSKDTDKKQKEKIKSYMMYAIWTASVAVAGQTAGIEVRTAFVGEGAPIKITGKSEKGKKLDKIEGKVRGNKFHGKLHIPEDIETGDQVYFEVKCSKNSIDGESNRIPAKPLVKVSNLKWSQDEIQRGEKVTMSAEVEGLNNGTEVELVIYEHDGDGGHEKVTTLPGTVKKGKVEVIWEFDYHGDVKEIPTKEEMDKAGKDYEWPSFFFVVNYESHEHGKDKKHKLLKFVDWVDIKLGDQHEKVLAEQDYVLYLPNGKKIEGKSDAEGRIKETGLPPGRCRLEFPKLEGVLRK